MRTPEQLHSGMYPRQHRLEHNLVSYANLVKGKRGCVGPHRAPQREVPPPPPAKGGYHFSS